MTQLTTERIADGYKINLTEAMRTSELSYDGSKWIFTQEWMSELDSLRSKVVALLFNSRAKLFKNSPSQKTLDNLLVPWVTMDDNGDMNCDLPLPDSTKEGKANIVINGLLIKQAGITPIWQIASYSENTPVVDFDWTDRCEGNEGSEGSEGIKSAVENEFREITLIESEVPSEENEDTLRLNTDDEYNSRKFAAKERVKEARLKAILARRAAEVETTRYYNNFSNGDCESTFSEYDISDFDEEESETEDVSEA